jgi:hypothetical protein
VGVTPCPQFINNLVFTNQTSGTVALTFTLVGTNSLNLGSGGFTLAPGVGLPLSVFFNCNRTTSFTGTIRVTATQGQTTQTIDIPVTGTVQ